MSWRVRRLSHVSLRRGTDPGLQRRRLEAEMAERQRIYGEHYPIDDDFLAALAHMPPASSEGKKRLIWLMETA